ncbi:MAG: hypothetical protein ACOC12_10125 [Bacteroidota bacterium]
MQIQASEEVMRILHIMQKNADNPDFDMAELLKRDESEPPLSQPVFLRLLLEGYMSLYIYEQLPFVIKDGGKAHILRQYYQTMRQEGRTVSRRRDEYQGVLSFLTTDCPDVNARVAKTGYNMPAIAKVVKEYNSCKGHDTRDTGGVAPSVRIRPGITLLVGSATLNLESNPEKFSGFESSSHSVNTIAPGVGIMIDFPYLGNSLRISASAYYYTVNFDDIVYPYTQGSVITREERFTMKHDYLKFPVIIHYSPFTSPWNPSLLLGPVINFNIRDQYVHETYSFNPDNDNVQITPRAPYHLPVVMNTGIMAGIEVYRPVGNRGNISLRICYEYAGSPFKPNYDSQYSKPFTQYANMGLLNLQVGYYIGSR